MLDRLVEVSDSMRSAVAMLIPALCGCPDCGHVRMIAAPLLGTCVDCGTALVPLEDDQSARNDSRASLPNAA